MDRPERGWKLLPTVASFHAVQRLFATFPDRQPGAALLLLRLSVAGVLVVRGPTYWAARPSLWWMILCDAVALLLAIGLFTPVTAIAGAVAGAAALLLCKTADPVAGVFVTMVTAALGLLGAGAYSVDARLYGRREVVVPSRPEGLPKP